jgi:hypothetical protein
MCCTRRTEVSQRLAKEMRPRKMVGIASRVMAGVLITCLSACDDQPKSGQNWREMGSLTDGTRAHFVLVDPDHLSDAPKIIEDAKARLCSGSGNFCEITFYSRASDIPRETTAKEFYGHGGYKDRKGFAQYFHNETTHLTTLTWDCVSFPQTSLEHCFNSPRPTEAMWARAGQRGPLKGYGKIELGMSATAAAKALGVPLGPDGPGGRYLRKDEALFGSTFHGVYTIRDNVVSVIYFFREQRLPDVECVNALDSLSKMPVKPYGEADYLSYYNDAHTRLARTWLFSNKRQVRVTNILSKDGNCALGIAYEPIDDD